MKQVNKLRVLGRDTRGLSTVEYTILLVLIVAGTVGLWNDFGKDLVGKLTKAKTDLPLASSLVQLLASGRGSVFVEYVVLLITVAIPLAAATLALGQPLFRLYQTQVAVLFLPIPY